MSALDKCRDITYVKSYIRYEYDNVVRCIYSVSQVEDGKVRFVFRLPQNISKCDWYCNKDFNYNIDSFCAYSGDILLIDQCEENEYKQFSHCSLELVEGKELVVCCTISSNSWGEIIHNLKNEYSNRCAHIEQLLQSERELKKCISEMKKDEKEMLKEIEKLNAIESSLGFRMVRLPGKICKFLVGAFSKI